MKLKLLLSSLALSGILLSGATSAANDTTGSVIPGLGSRLPNTPDISKSKNFHVYKITKDGVDFIQINSLNNDVLTAIAMGNGTFSTVPIGSLNASQVMLPSNLPQATGIRPLDAPVTPIAPAGQCPCSSNVVYSGSNGTVIVVVDSQNNVIQVITLPPPTPSRGTNPA